ncbi:MAG: hypothetical protein IJ766_07775 [Clostridia bacterium]|nr:hypothetical protein [Clostridia bacterium]
MGYTDGCFLCLPCKGGYFSFYGDFCDPETAGHIYILKGANGLCSGYLLKTVCKRATALSIPVEKVYSRSRPGALEALALPQQRLYILDGSFPRAFEPKYPLAAETVVSTDDCFDREMLEKNKAALILIGKIMETERRRTMQYLAAVRSINADSSAILYPCVDRDKIRRYALRFAAREFPASEGRKKPRSIFLSGITAQGVTVHYDTLKKYPIVNVIDDRDGAAASVLIENLKTEAEKRGLTAIVCRCQTDPENRAEHLLLPEAGTAFFTANRYHPAPERIDRTIHVSRFLDTEKLAANRMRLNFNKKAVRSLIEEAVAAEARVQDLQDMIDAYYEAALDTQRLEQTAAALTQDIFARIG